LHRPFFGYGPGGGHDAFRASADDSLKNVEAARALGMPAIHFQRGVDLESELDAHGALP
jgi:hypothetical protein